jgi:thiamine transport system permease protein
MARGSGAISFGSAAALIVAALILAPLGAVLWRAGGFGAPGPADWAAVRFTLLQATLSALFSAALALPVARALARRKFPAHGAVVALMGAPFILPVIVAVMGLLAIFGWNGVLNDLLQSLGLPRIEIYGLHGIILAHVFFNLPLAARLLLEGWRQIPAERFRLAEQMGASPRDMFRIIEWPMLRERLPGIVAVIFAICLSSFATVLILGQGPAATTIELAIYQAFTFEFDLGRAAVLAAIQSLLVLSAALLALRVARGGAVGGGLDRPHRIWAGGTGLRLWDGAVIALAIVFVGLPLIMVVLRGLGHVVGLPASVWGAAGTSAILALTSTALTLITALAMALAARRWIEVTGLMTLAVSPLVLGVGLFLLIRPFAFPSDYALTVTCVVNAAMALPFALRAIVPGVQAAERDFGRLADGLGLRGWARLRWLILPRLRRPLGYAAGLTAALSCGDLGVIALFPPSDTATLPLQVYRLMGSYRTQDAAGAALVLVVLSFGFFLLFDRLGRHAET